MIVKAIITKTYNEARKDFIRIVNRAESVEYSPNCGVCVKMTDDNGETVEYCYPLTLTEKQRSLPLERKKKLLIRAWEKKYGKILTDTLKNLDSS